ncbi:MAG: 4-(cytidine 5'-diphospho)-2-C-methyl-D-erythritol kinase [Bacteroidales bacterium]|nr:4-(cytidine 5'-diphospho)-2-C-methyl-D-erythritol kinase [Bacteroidales bacterium]
MIAFSNAKINLGLNIIKKRSDNYHNIKTIFLPISLYDIIEILPSHKDDLIIYGYDIEHDNNTCLKALNILRDKYNIECLKVIIYKNIPPQSGLGGGSSNAAFTLILLNEMYNLNLSTHELVKIARKIGADCPFFIYNKPLLATLKGDKFNDININLTNYKICLIIHSKIKILTKWAYSLVTPKKPEFDLSATEKVNLLDWKKYIKNDFEEYIFNYYPELKEIKNVLYNKGALYASLSGSGSCVYGIFPEKVSIDLPNVSIYWCNVI